MSDGRFIAALTASVVAHGLLALLVPEPVAAPEVVTGQVRVSLRALAVTPALAPATATPVPDKNLVSEDHRPATERNYDRQSSSAHWPDAVMSQTAHSADIPSDDDPAQQRRIYFEGLRQYHAALAQAAATFRRQPAPGLDGRVALRLRVVTGGIPSQIGVLGSSGHEELDRAALELIRLAASHTPVPESLRHRDFDIDLALDYRGTDEVP